MPTSNYPTSLDTTSTQVTPTSTTDLDATGYEHDLVHGAASTALIALQTKLGISATPAASASNDALLTHTGTGTTAWSNTITGSTIAGTTLSGAVVGADQIMSAVVHKDYAETVYVGGNTSTAVTLDETNGNTQTWTMTGACTFTMPSGAGLQAGTALTLILTQDGTGSRTGAFTSVKWAGATAPTLTTTATTGIDILTFITFNGGAAPTWFGFTAGAAMA
tara:strand:- start:1875 stop:2537 length:663 start_codon:yes stop_codon:yes gene_type:complete